MAQGRIIAMGDIHGCSKALRVLFEKLQLGPRDRLIGLGDYINKGADSKGVIELLLSTKAQFVGLMGNHEILLMSSLGIESKVFPSSISCYSTVSEQKLAEHGVFDLMLSSYGHEADIKTFDLPSEHIRFLQNLRPYYHLNIRGRKFFLVHAGLKQKALAQRTLRQAIEVQIEEDKPNENHSFFWQSRLHLVKPQFDAIIIHGHTPWQRILDKYGLEKFKFPGINYGRICLDGGCFEAQGSLVAYDITNDKFYTIDSASF